jgi:hypothetical protein
MGGIPRSEVARAVVEATKPLSTGMSAESLRRVLGIVRSDMPAAQAEALASRAFHEATSRAVEVLAASLGSAPDGWQPIETAPKDGSTVLLWCVRAWERDKPFPVTAYWHRPGGKPGPKEHWALVECGGYAEDDELSGDPTHWMNVEPPR